MTVAVLAERGQRLQQPREISVPICALRPLSAEEDASFRALGAVGASSA